MIRMDHEICFKTHKQGKDVIIAMCDADVVGKTFREGQFKLHVNHEFYDGARLSLEEGFARIDQATIINLTGPKVVERAVKEGVVHREAIIRISGVPHAMWVKI